MVVVEVYGHYLISSKIYQFRTTENLGEKMVFIQQQRDKNLFLKQMKML